MFLMDPRVSYRTGKLNIFFRFVFFFIEFFFHQKDFHISISKSGEDIHRNKNITMELNGTTMTRHTRLETRQ